MAVAQRSTHEPQEYALGRWDSRPDDSTMAGSLTREQDVASGCDDDGFDGVDSTRQRRRYPVDVSARWARHSPGVEWTLTTRPAAAVLEKEGSGAAASRAIGTTSPRTISSSYESSSPYSTRGKEISMVGIT